MTVCDYLLYLKGCKLLARTMLKLLCSIFIICLYIGTCHSNPGIFDLVADESKEYVQGGGKSYDNVHQSQQGEAGKKAYVSKHQKEQGLQGHHDNERHQQKYAQEGGSKKSQSHDDGYYAGGHKGSHGEKGYSYVDKGSYAKGHSTKGHHDVHKLDEFQKKKTFFDEDHDEADQEKHGGYEVGKDFKNGQFKYGGHAKKVYFEGEFGASGKAEKGDHDFEEAGHKRASGKDAYFKDAEEFVKKGNSELFKNFGFNVKKQE
ncbi:uncharacterized protein LOC115877371 [Sitophilus oryzae]|uniref:Uncharacterized protein LOC115877371 n=1 Tax=Sitophilus oryzae TaxID=7048 RepID=A0A6J2XDQ6_SITOR|nr:uncharacterized protein LOC115877371 [Sitophilus oryzae]